MLEKVLRIPNCGRITALELKGHRFIAAAMLPSDGSKFHRNDGAKLYRSDSVKFATAIVSNFAVAVTH